MLYDCLGFIKNTSPLYQKNSLVYIDERSLTSYLVEVITTGDRYYIESDQLHVFLFNEKTIKIFLQNTPHLLDKFQKEIEAWENTKTSFAEALSFGLFPIVEGYPEKEKIDEFKVTEESPVNIKRLI